MYALNTLLPKVLEAIACFIKTFLLFGWLCRRLGLNSVDFWAYTNKKRVLALGSNLK
ncbi:BnaC03g62290D [Brassica napus]|uniref:Uncharacterized protein n=2 Tax=Brassica TaxID=3705 RepID=A0A3P6BNI5_BRAOL|nr:unnamed protein product [Brassica napus]CDY41655.1 BnaC03g62290D [Brassica napus]VDC98980.1 unnamed protein product [Brassica oleracea]